ncbi:solute carrier family 15 member 1-like isoform X1 [Bradysia coprophila]|uniref:solute carrier family 15 member 1-like isoform X1 n=2 Tax=Bradysia coprophila TaxID=38358 RepID=UPI00187DCB6F|nr:solute carrier family 15 member 1-like isoform X1 [Bradysia coprophila]
MENTKSDHDKRKRRVNGIFAMPKAVPAILLNILLERFSTNATLAILVLYLNRKLSFDPSLSTALFHTNELLAYGFTIFGAIIADSWWGHFKTILWMSLVFAVGSVIVSVGSIEQLHLPTTAFTIVGLLIAVVGSGSTRANLIAFGGDQYEASDQGEELKLYFSIQIFFLKTGSLLGRFVNPMLKNIECFGMSDCYPVGFGTPAIAMIVGFLLLLTVKSSCLRKPPSGNMLIKVIRCMMDAIAEKWKRHNEEPKSHWLDYAEMKHGAHLVAETKIVIGILKLYIPLPIFWAVYMQQGSRWIFQATRMNGDIGFYTVTPDQMIVLNPAFVIISLPLCNYVIYPLISKFQITTLLQKMTIGGMLAVVASIVAAVIENKIDKNFLNILWLAPQFFLLALSENFLFVSHLSFAYTEAPASMKSVMTSFVFVVIAVGNLFVVFISGSKIFESQSIEFLFFAGILFVSMLIFGGLAYRYQPIHRLS